MTNAKSNDRLREATPHGIKSLAFALETTPIVRKGIRNAIERFAARWERG